MAIAKHRATGNGRPQQLLRKLFPPMLATLTDAPPENDQLWTYELKYDGFRAVVALAEGEMAMWSRNELDLAPRFPGVSAAVKKLKIAEVVLDGEIVALDAAGVPRFQLLQGGENERIFIFDVLWLAGEDLRRKPYTERRVILEKLLKRAPAGVELAHKMDEPGSDAIKHAAAAGYEGIIAKRNTSPYEGRRSKDWLKVKAINQQELAVVGYTLSTASNRDIGALHLGVMGDDGELHYAGKVGTGFSSKLRGQLLAQLEQERVDKPQVRDAPRSRDTIWVRPRLVAQVAFTEWTGDNRLRHPSFLGLRDDKSPSEVVREKPAAMTTLAEKPAPKPKPKATPTPTDSKPKAAPATTKRAPTKSAAPARPAGTVTLTHPERVLYPKSKITKQELADYYQAVSAPMIHALHGRPLSLEHSNQGIGHPSWFHQNLGKEAPEWLPTVDTPTRTGSRKSVRHLVANTPEALRWLAQMSALTVHMWSSREGSLEQPDWVVFDLDPAKGKGIEQAIEAALVMRRLLDNLELPSYPKTSGKRGIHLFIPLAPGHTHEQAAEFACNVAAAVSSKVPDFTVDRPLDQRRGRLYLDCMQNAYGKTMVAPYSPRAIEGAPVSAPLKWSEVTRKLDPLAYTIRTMPARLAKVGDLFAPVLEGGVKLPKFA